MLGGRLVNVIGPSVFVNCCLCKLGSYLPTKIGRQRHYVPWYLLKRMAPRSLRKTLLGCKIGKSLGEYLYHKEAEKEFIIANTCLKCSQAEGNIKIFLIISYAGVWGAVRCGVLALILLRNSTGMACKSLIHILHLKLYYIHVYVKS